MRWKDDKYISSLELAMALIIEDEGLDVGMTREFGFHPTRRWRLDFAWPEKKVGVEVHGAIWSGKRGGHTSGRGRIRDMEKMNEATLHGWRVLEIGGKHIRNGQAIKWLRRLLEE